jgi:hypothetical protein
MRNLRGGTAAVQVTPASEGTGLGSTFRERFIACARRFQGGILSR